MKQIDLISRLKSLILRVDAFWYSIRSSYWFIPAIMMIGAVVLYFVMIYIDNYVIHVEKVTYLEWLSVNKPEGARSLLSTVAGSMITVTGVVFSITIVALTLASSQFGPRLLENFMQDRGNQIVLGTFIATFVYCILLLRTVRGGEKGFFIPHLSITVGFILTMMSIVVLIYFIHHAATSIQASHVITITGGNLDRAIDKLFPQRIGQGKKVSGTWWVAPEESPGQLGENRAPVHADSSGYVRVVDNSGIMSMARSKDVIIEILYKPGDFIVEGSTLAYVMPENSFTETLGSDITGSFIIGTKRTIEQDSEYAIYQLVEIAVRALSPGINDPFTAIMCIDRLTSALCRMAEREIPSPYRYDEKNQLRVIARTVRFPDMLDSSFNQIRQYGRQSAAVTISVLDSLAVIAQRVTRDEDKKAVLRHAEMIKRGSEEGLPEPHDRKDAEESYVKVLEVLSMTAADAPDVIPPEETGAG